MLFWVMVGVLSLFAAHAQEGPAKFVGSNACKTCHADVWLNFYRNPHYKTLLGEGPPEKQGCEGCHGGAAAHIEANGGKATIPRAFSLMSAERVLDACLTCHSKDFSRANIRRSQHTLANIVCTNCHSVHKSTTPKFLLAKRQIDMCGGCHRNVRAQFSMPFKHRVNEGFMQCSDCHNPHGTFAPTWRSSQRPRMVNQALGNEEACLKCHTDKRGPFTFEHPPVRVEGCESCHNPHGSMNPRLLKRPVTFTMCLECHSGAGNFGRQGDGIQIQSATHNMSDPRYQNCTTCHVRIHGSNSDPRFLR